MMDRESERGVARLKRGAALAEVEGGAGRGAKASADRVMKSRSATENERFGRVKRGRRVWARRSRSARPGTSLEGR
jgi:hypothetical protein